MCQIDVSRFVSTVAEARRLATAGADAPAAAMYQVALDLWRGDVVETAPLGALGLTVSDRWANARTAAETELLAIRARTTPTADVIASLQAAVERQPHDEDRRVVLIDAMRRSGDVTGARTALRDAIGTLDRDLGLAPRDALRRLALDLGLGVSAFAPLASGDTALDVVRQAVATLDPPFEVTDVLERSRDNDLDEADVLDQLEELVERGELRRYTEEDGRIRLTPWP
jgi:DNA-binding SARP family transcriptional activator